jgi:hypothetical protein
MVDETLTEEIATIPVGVNVETVPDKVNKAFEYFEQNWEGLYALYKRDTDNARYPYTPQHIMNFVVDKSLLDLGKAYSEAGFGPKDEKVKGLTEGKILNFIVGYNKHDFHEEAAVSLAKWIKDASELEDVGILGKDQKSLLKTANEMFVVEEGKLVKRSQPNKKK